MFTVQIQDVHCKSGGRLCLAQCVWCSIPPQCIATGACFHMRQSVRDFGGCCQLQSRNT